MTTDLADLAERCRNGRAKFGDDAIVIIEAATVEALIADAVELRNLRTLLAALPDDDWQPFDWAVFTLAQEQARAALEVWSNA